MRELIVDKDLTNEIFKKIQDFKDCEYNDILRIFDYDGYKWLLLFENEETQKIIYNSTCYGINNCTHSLYFCCVFDKYWYCDSFISFIPLHYLIDKHCDKYMELNQKFTIDEINNVFKQDLNNKEVDIQCNIKEIKIIGRNRKIQEYTNLYNREAIIQDVFVDGENMLMLWDDENKTCHFWENHDDVIEATIDYIKNGNEEKYLNGTIKHFIKKYNINDLKNTKIRYI